MGQARTLKTWGQARTLRHTLFCLPLGVAHRTCSALHRVTHFPSSPFRHLHFVSYGQPSIEIFARKLGRCDDEYVCHQSARIVARLLLGGGDPDEATLRGYYQWLLDEIRSTDKARLLLALSCLAQSFRRPALRMAFCHIGGAVDMLWALVAVDASIQQQYQATLCLWILSFSNDAIEAMGESISACVKAVADVLNAAKKEKVVRVCVAFLRNVAECTDRSKALEMRMLMVSHRLLGTMQGLASQATYTYVLMAWLCCLCCKSITSLFNGAF